MAESYILAYLFYIGLVVFCSLVFNAEFYLPTTVLMFLWVVVWTQPALLNTIFDILFSKKTRSATSSGEQTQT
jgi:phosphatidylglycerophosphatase A